MPGAPKLEILLHDPFKSALSLLGLILPAATVWAKLATSRRAVVAQPRAVGFEPRGARYEWRDQGQVWRATLRRPDTHLRLQITAPPLPVHVASFRAGNYDDRSRHVLAGDSGFDEAVLVQHPSVRQGLACLSAEVRAAARDAVALRARTVDGRWQFQGVCSSLLDVQALVDAMSRAHTATSSLPTETDGLERLVLSDPHPAVRVRALEVLAHEAPARPKLVAWLVEGDEPAVQLALVEAGGCHAGQAWGGLIRTGDRLQRARGAIELARHVSSGAVEDVNLDARVDELLGALDESTQAHWVPDAQAGQKCPPLLRQVLSRFGNEPPKVLSPLVAALRDAQRPAVRGGVSLAAAAGGQVSVAEPR